MRDTFFFNRQSGPNQEIVGTWYDTRDQVIVFNGDGTLTATNTRHEKRKGKWEITPANKLRIKISPSIDGESPLLDPDLNDPVTRLSIMLDNYSVRDDYVSSVFHKK